MKPELKKWLVQRLAILKQLKEKGGKGRLDDIEEAEDKAVYDVVRARSLQYVVFDDPPLVSRRSDRGGGDRDW